MLIMDQARAFDDQDLGLTRRCALQFIILIGAVSLFADMTYEGARSVSGPFLAVLGASATVVGIVAGAGELLGYGLRLASGYLSDRTGRYWTITIVGYAINLFAVPLLALADHWGLAAVLIVAERAGRGIRIPARDAMLSHAASQTGLGWGFGLHEALDQTGAIVGPLLVSGILYLKGSYQLAFAILLIPAVVAFAIVVSARLAYPRPQDLELAPPALESTGLPRAFWIYATAAACIAAGYADFPLIAYHFEKATIVPGAWIPVLYAVAMGTDAIAALVLGRLFDRIGLRTMVGATVLSALTPPLAFLGGAEAAVVAMLLWGVGMGAQESIVRAAVAQLAPAEHRATAYGIFNAIYGVAWFAGSVLLGVLYDRSILALVVIAMILQLAALPILVWLIRTTPEQQLG
jgi:MFS family permease